MYLTFLIFSLFSGEAAGDEFKLTPSLGLKEAYNDNIFFAPKDRPDLRFRDFVTTISPGLELIDRTERLDLNLFTRINDLIYAKNHDLNDYEQDYRGRLAYSLLPRLKLSAEARYLEDVRPDREIEVSGLVLLKPLRRVRQNYVGGAEYDFSEKTKANLSYSYEEDKFAKAGYPNMKMHDGSIGFVHDLSKYISSTMGRMNLGYGNYDFQISTSDYYYGTIGMSRALSEKWSILIDAGASYTSSEFIVQTLQFVPPFFVIVSEKKKSENWSWIGSATLSYRGEKTPKGEKSSMDLSFIHRVMPGLALGTLVERTMVTIDMRHRFTYELSGTLSAGYYINKVGAGQYSAVSLNYALSLISPAVRYEFTKDIALEASYTYSLYDNKIANTLAERNLFMINFTIKYPLFE